MSEPYNGGERQKRANKGTSECGLGVSNFMHVPGIRRSGRRGIVHTDPHAAFPQRANFAHDARHVKEIKNPGYDLYSIMVPIHHLDLF